MNKQILSDNELEHVVGGNMFVNITVSPNVSAADYFSMLLVARPQFLEYQDKFMDIAALMDRDGKKIARLEFDQNNRLVSISIG